MPVFQQKPEDAMKRLVEKAAGSDLASLGELVSRIMQTLRNPASSAGELKELIEVDPPLCAKVLARANSAYYGFKREISSIQDAIVFIGYNAINELCLSMKMGKFFEQDSCLEFYSRKSLWAHSLAVAICAKLIFRRELGQRGDNIYSAALLHDLGVMVEEQFAYTSFREVVARSKGERSFVSVEKEIFGFDHAQVGEALALQWNLPDWMGKAIRLHHKPPVLKSENSDLDVAAKTIFIADIACRLNGFSWEAPPSKEDLTTWDRSIDAMDIKAKAIDIIVLDVKDEIKRLQEVGDLYL